MKFNYLWLSAILWLATPTHAEETGALERAYVGALKAADKAFGPGKRPHQIDKNKQPQIIIKGNELRYNAKVLALGETLENWVMVLGKPTRFNGSNVYTWDGLGIKTYVASKGAEGPGFTEKISTIEIFLNEKPRDQFFEHLPNSNPKNTFPGYLEIDGAGVDRASRVWEVNANKNMYGDPSQYAFRRDYLPTIFTTYSPSPVIYMRFYTDQDGREGLIYYLSAIGYNLFFGYTTFANGTK